MSHIREKRRGLGFAACSAASGFWGFGFFFGKIALAEMNVGAMVFYRFLFACIVLLPILITHKPGLNRREWGVLLLASFFGIPVQFLLEFYGLSLTTVADASLMIGMMPVVIAVGAAIFAHERMNWKGWVALAASTTGAGLIALGGHAGAAGRASRIGDGVVLLSLLVALAWILMNKQLMERHSPVVISAYGLFAGTLMLAAIVPAIWGLPPVSHISVKAWGALVASGVLCTAVTTLLWNWGLTQVPASQAGIVLNMEPLIGSLLGVLVLHEVLGASAWVGGGLILAAAVALTLHGETSVGKPMLRAVVE